MDAALLSSDSEICRLEIPPAGPPRAPGCAVFNNYLFQQDPQTGRLSLLPVLVRAPHPLPGLDISPFLVPHLLLSVPSPTPEISVQRGERLSICGGPESEGHIQDASEPDDRGHPGVVRPHAAAKRGSDPAPAEVHPALTDVIHLLKGQFSLEGCLEHHQEDVAMGTSL